MAATRINRYLLGADRITTAEIGDRFDFELDEAEVWAMSEKISRDEPVSNTRPVRKPARKVADVCPRSLPVSIPVWSKTLGDDCDFDEEEYKIPPHEYLARTRIASLSVQEGVGRTLKGRDMSRVRNAIWKKFGFED